MDGHLLRNTVHEAAMKMDRQLIRLLLTDDETKKRFFTEIEGIYIFDKIEFGWMICHRAFLPNSFTRLKNKIGLVDGNDSFIATGQQVVLSFPYKDCVLAGGQTKDEQKRNEVFYNATRAPEEIDHLFHPKVLSDAIRYSKNQSLVVERFHTLDNLLIKGNHLLAISSLLPQFTNRIKSHWNNWPRSCERTFRNIIAFL